MPPPWPSTAPIRRVFYGWWIVAAGFAIEALIGALMFHAYGAYLVLLREEFGWSKTLLSAAFAMARAESGILGPIQGWLTDRFGPARPHPRRHDHLRRRLHALQPDRVAGDVLRDLLHDGARLEPRRLPARHGGHRRTGSGAGARWRSASAPPAWPSGGLLVQGVVLALSRFGWRWTAFASGILVLAGRAAHRPARPSPSRALRLPARRRSEPPRDQPARRSRRGERWISRRERPCAPAPSGSSRSVTARRSSVVSAVMVHLIVHVTERLGYSLRQSCRGAGPHDRHAGERSAHRRLGGRPLRASDSSLSGCMLAHAVGARAAGLAPPHSGWWWRVRNPARSGVGHARAAHGQRSAPTISAAPPSARSPGSRR